MTPDIPFRIEAAGPFPHEPGRRVLAAGRWSDTDRRPDPAADDALAADLGGALATRQAAEPTVRAGLAVWQQRDEAAS